MVILYAPDEALVRRRYPLGAAVTTVGRSRDNDIVVVDDSISRRHARFERRDDGWWLVAESTHGTFVNDEQVQQQRRLRVDDRVQIGRLIVRVIRSDIPFEIVEVEYTGPIDGLTGALSRSSRRIPSTPLGR